MRMGNKLFKQILIVVMLVGLLCLFAGCGEEKPDKNATPVPGQVAAGIDGYGNTLNGGRVCADGEGGIYFVHPSDGGLMHLNSLGTVVRIGQFADIAQMVYGEGKLYFYGDEGYTDEQELI
jgi:hypothetical protein